MNGSVPDTPGLVAEALDIGNPLPTETQPMMDGIQDLIDERQVALFDVFDQLSRLGGKGRIESPQLVVVGDQSSGKSSVLEAIGRFHFPVHAGTCTRFPTKLIMRRAATERTELSIEPGKSRSEADRTRLLEFHAQPSSPDELAAWMARASDALGVPSSPSTTGPSVTRDFADNVLVVKKQGPNLPLVNLIDLPGIFRVASNEQGGPGRDTVERLAKEHVKNKKNLVLLVVHARCSVHNQSAPEVVQDIAKNDPGLADRVVGVITNPDHAQFHEEFVRILNGTLTSEDLKIYRWHVVRNQSQAERADSLEQRDMREAMFFRDQPDWQAVPDAQRGIGALKGTIKNGFWLHTKAALPGLISEVESRTEQARALVTANGKARDTDRARLQYLHAVARAFERFTQQACLGIYQNDNCNQSHKAREECGDCKRFFPPFGDGPSEDHGKNLRATVRALNRTFASAMGKCGKTVKVTKEGEEDGKDRAKAGEGKTGVEAGSAADGEPQTAKEEQPNEGSKTEEADSFLAKAVVDEYYTHALPQAVERTEFEVWVATQIDCWAGRGPSGGASETAYHGLFEYQSNKWQEIAERHLAAVWKAVDWFVEAALAAACPDEHVRLALRDHLTDSKLERLKKASDGALKSLLQCHARGNTGFYDGFCQTRAVVERAADVSRDLRQAVPALDSIGSLGEVLGSSRRFNKFVGGLSRNLALMQTAGLIRPELVRGVAAVRAVRTALSAVVTRHVEADGGVKKKRRVLKLGLGLSARLVQNVEMYYEVSNEGVAPKTGFVRGHVLTHRLNRADEYGGLCGLRQRPRHRKRHPERVAHRHSHTGPHHQGGSVPACQDCGGIAVAGHKA